MTLKERGEEKMKMMSSPWWWIGAVLYALIFTGACEGYKSWCHHMDEKRKQEKNEQETKKFMDDLEKEIKKGYDFSVGQTSKEKPAYPQWSDCGGDYKACRGLFLKNIEIINTDNKYRNWSYIVHPYIKGDVLWLYSMHFHKMYIREQVALDLHQMFVDCNFTKVMVAITRSEGQGYWEIWNKDKKVKQ